MVQSQVSLIQNGTAKGSLFTEWFRERFLSLLQNGTGRCYYACYRMVQGGVIKLVTEWNREVLLSLLQNGTGSSY